MRLPRSTVGSVGTLAGADFSAPAQAAEANTRQCVEHAAAPDARLRDGQLVEDETDDWGRAPGGRTRGRRGDRGLWTGMGIGDGDCGLWMRDEG